MATDTKLADIVRKFGELEAELASLAPHPKKKQVLFVYSSKHLKGSGKVRFFYALKGRQKYHGILEKTNSKFLKRGVILSSLENFRQISEFLKSWGCKFTAFQIEKEMNAK